MRIADSGTPTRTNQSRDVGQNGRVRQHLTNQRQDHDHTCVSVPGAEKILSQRVFHVTASFVHQRGQQKIPAVLNRRYGDEDDPGHHSGFASHRFSLDTSISRGPPTFTSKAAGTQFRICPLVPASSSDHVPLLPASRLMCSTHSSIPLGDCTHRTLNTSPPHLISSVMPLVHGMRRWRHSRWNELRKRRSTW